MDLKRIFRKSSNPRHVAFYFIALSACERSVPSAAPKARSVGAHHPERHLCKSVGSVGNKRHPEWLFLRISALSTQGGQKANGSVLPSQPKAGRKPMVAHSPVNPRRAESPMASLAQGKRSDTLGKPPHPITPRPARAKVNITCSVSALLPLQGASCTRHIFYPGRRFACRWAMHFCPFGACPINAPHRTADTSALRGVPV